MLYFGAQINSNYETMITVDLFIIMITFPLIFYSLLLKLILTFGVSSVRCHIAVIKLVQKPPRNPESLRPLIHVILHLSSCQTQVKHKDCRTLLSQLLGQSSSQ